MGQNSEDFEVLYIIPSVYYSALILLANKRGSHRKSDPLSHSTTGIFYMSSAIEPIYRGTEARSLFVPVRASFTKHKVYIMGTGSSAPIECMHAHAYSAHDAEPERRPMVDCVRVLLVTRSINMTTTYYPLFRSLDCGLLCSCFRHVLVHKTTALQDKRR